MGRKEREEEGRREKGTHAHHHKHRSIDYRNSSKNAQAVKQLDFVPSAYELLAAPALP